MGGFDGRVAFGRMGVWMDDRDGLSPAWQAETRRLFLCCWCGSDGRRHSSASRSCVVEHLQSWSGIQAMLHAQSNSVEIIQVYGKSKRCIELSSR